MKTIYSMYRADEVSVHRHAASRLSNRTDLEGEVRFVHAQDQQSEIVTECLLTRSIFKMHVHGIYT